MRTKSNTNCDVEAVDPEDFQAFVAARSAHLYRTACLLTCGDTHMAEDLVQETLVSMCLRWGKRHRIDNPAGYAQTSLVNAFISNRRKKSSRELPNESIGNTTAAAVAAAEPGIDVELRVTLIGALGHLPALDRAVVVLRFWEDRSVEETANMLKLNANTVRSRSSRALKRLRDLLGTDYIEFAAN